ncbi:MAG TPA: metallophosphoesterase [Desulfomonilia bacterium]
MKKIYRSVLFTVILSVALLTACSSVSSNTVGTSKVVVFSDVHFNPFYDQTLFDTLVAADAAQWKGIFESSSISEPSAWGEDSNYPLFAQALSSIKENSSSSSIAIFPGDILVHDFETQFYKLYGSEDEAAMRLFLLKTATFFAIEVRAHLGSIPVMFALGNNDSYEGDYKIEPDSRFLNDTAEPFYNYFLNGVMDHDFFNSTYRTGGYYSAAPLGPDLLVITLNSIFFSPKAAGGTGEAATAELDWFEKTLASAASSGKKVWIVTHIPVGANISSNRKLIDGGGQIDDAKMMWVDEYQTRFLNILSAYPDTVAMMFTGHTHMDEYRLPLGALQITQGISPVDGNNPAYKIFSFDEHSFSIKDYVSFNRDLSEPSGRFNSYYNFSSSYLLNDLLLDGYLDELLPLLKTDLSRQELYRRYYYSGHDGGNPITDANWPAYWCGIGEMSKEGYMDCVNSYGQ